MKTGHLGKQIRNNLRSFEMWCSARMEKASWTDWVKKGEVLYRVKEEENNLSTI